MALDNRFVIAYDFQQYFVDKDTGLPLAAGVITTYEDNNRTELKPLYRITGTPPNYEYLPLPNPLTLSGVGTIQDEDGNDVAAYFFPYDGTPETTTNQLTLYYMTVESEGAVAQFTREGLPNVFGDETSDERLINYVPNPQFLIHYDIPATNSSAAGEITQAVTVLGAGGWTFERPNTSTATDFVTFPRYDAAVSIPTGSPRYACRLRNTVPNGADTYKGLRLKYRDVNKFSSDTQTYTFCFSAISNSGSSVNLNINVIKNYGTGGSTSTTTFVQTVTVTTAEQVFNIPIIFGTNEAKTIGPDDDDYVQIEIGLPTGATYDVSITDVIQSPGELQIEEFPQVTDASMLTNSVGGWMPVPNPDGSDLYLPLRLTASGLEFDSSNIGKVFASTSATPEVGELLMDGSQYETAAYSSDGIPYSRLQQKWWDDTLQLPLFGTGDDYFTAYLSDLSPATQLRISTNKASSPGSVTNASDGAIATGFSIATRHVSNSYNVNGVYTVLNTPAVLIMGIPSALGAVTNPTAGTSGFTISFVNNNSNVAMSFFINTTTAAGLAGTYFTFSSLHPNTLVQTNYYVWFKVDGAGADPAPGGTGIEVDLLSTYTEAEVAANIREAVSGFQITTIITLAASGLTAGCYFNINTSTDSFYVWYKIDDTGNDPAPTGKEGIEVDILSTDTAAQVASKTQRAINSKYFKVGDYRGMFLRGVNGSALIDHDDDNRWSYVTSIYGDQVGTNQLSSNQSHNHTTGSTSFPAFFTTTTLGAPAKLAAGVDTAFDNVLSTLSYTGGYESRPTNTYVWWMVKY